MAANDIVLSNWSVLVDDFETSGQDFFERVQATVEAREVPEVSFERLEYKEGGIASAKRTYLRIKREQLVFDLSAAPFGTGYFFSWWLQRLGPRYPFLYLLGMFVALLISASILSSPFGNLGAVAVFVLVFLFIGPLALGFVASQGLFGPPEIWVSLPFIGWLYDRVFSPVTFYTQDQTAMYQESIRRAVNEVIDEILTSQSRSALSSEQKAIKERLNQGLVTVAKL